MIRRPSAAFLFSHPAHFIALGFGSGLSPFAPGTVGTLLAIPLYDLAANWLDPAQLAVLLCLCFALGVWACQITGNGLGIPDHSGMNWDEVVAFMFVLMLTPQGVAWRALAFFAFRCFDVVKPPPIRTLERRVKGGLGVMVDDVAAAFYTLLVLAVAKRLFI